MSPTADQLRTIKIAASNEVRRYLRELRDETLLGMKLGFLADSSMDGFPMSDPDNFTVRPMSFAGGATDRVIVRAEDDLVIQDFIVSVRFGRPYIPSSYSIREDMRKRKDLH